MFDRLTAAAAIHIANHEPGTSVYATHTVTGEPLARVFYELYADEEAFRQREQAPHVVDFHRRKDVLLVGKPRVEFLTPGPAMGKASG